MISPVHDMRQPPAPAGNADRGLDREAVARAGGLDPARVAIVESTGSTNQDLMSRPAGLDVPAPRVLIAARQTAGRGRRGRGWLSEPPDCLAMSISVHRVRDASAPVLTGLPIALGIAIADVLAAQVHGIGLKWPNDLLRDGRKCAGMLVEARTVDELERVVIGLGLNWRLPATLAGQPAAPPPASGEASSDAAPLAPGGLFDALPPVEVRERIAGELARALVDCARRYLREGFGDTALAWARHDLLLGREIVVKSEGKTVLSGRADGLDRHGELRVRTRNGVQTVCAGEVSVRLSAAQVGGDGAR